MKRKKFAGRTYILLVTGLLILFLYQLVTLKNEYEREKVFLTEELRQSLILADYSELTMRVNMPGSGNTSIISFMNRMGYTGTGVTVRFMDIKEPTLIYIMKPPKPVKLKRMVDYEMLNGITMLATHSSIDLKNPIQVNILDSLLRMAFKERHLQPDYHLSLVKLAHGDSIMHGKNFHLSQLFNEKPYPVIHRRLLSGDSTIHTLHLEDLYYKVPMWLSRDATTYLYPFDLGRQNAYLLEVSNIPEMVLARILNIILFSSITFAVTTCLIISLIRKNQRLLRMKERETTIMQNMTHELKTPIAVSLAAIEALSDDEFPLPEEKRQKYYYILKEKLDELSERISRILHPLRLEQKLMSERKIKLRVLPKENLEIILRPLLKDISLRTNGSARLHTEIPPETAVPMRKDDLQRIFLNILDNAVKYSPDPPCISIKAYRKRRWLFVEVKDKGYGIPPKDLKHIFERFYRVENTPAQTTYGTGVGLNDVYETIQAYGGSISVKSKYGTGSCFTLKFKLA